MSSKRIPCTAGHHQPYLPSVHEGKFPSPTYAECGRCQKVLKLIPTQHHEWQNLVNQDYKPWKFNQYRFARDYELKFPEQAQIVKNPSWSK